MCWLRWSCSLRGGSAASCLLGFRVRIPSAAWMSVCFECCVLSGRGPEESYRVWYVSLSKIRHKNKPLHLSTNKWPDWRRNTEGHRRLDPPRCALNKLPTVAYFYRGAAKSLPRPERKQANVSVRMAWISFGALPCREQKKLDYSLRLDVVEIARVPVMLPSLFPSWSG